MEEQLNNKYHNSKIYTIRSHQCETYYIGSTTQALYKRLSGHRNDFKAYNKSNGGRYLTSFEIIKYDDHYIELLEEYKCENKQQLERREGELIRENKKNCINVVVAGRTIKEYNIDNFEMLRKKSEEYRKLHRNEAINRSKKYHEDNREIIIEKFKIYRNNNKEYFKEYEKNRKNKKERQNKLKEKINCACGSIVCISAKARHEKSQKHKEFINLS